MIEIPTLQSWGGPGPKTEDKRSQGRPRKEPPPKVSREPMPMYSTLLPAPVRVMLMAAAKVEDSFARRKAIDAAYGKAALMYPNLFKTN